MTTADLRVREECQRLVAEARPDTIVHAAAYPDPDFCEEHPDEARRLNVDSVRYLMECAGVGVRFVFISSDYVFDGKAPPYVESSRRNPVSVYGRTKCESEDLLAGRPNTLVVRMPLLMGAGPSLERSGFIYQILKSLTITDQQVLDDVLVRFPTWIEDVAKAIEFLLKKDADGVYHISGPRGGTRFDWTVDMAGVIGASTGHLVRSKAVVPRKAVRPRDSQLSTAKLAQLGFEAYTDFRTVAKSVLRLFGWDFPV
jgi:S-adenosylmethionine synthetase